MASGDQVVHIIDILQPGANQANHDVRVGGSTPAEEIQVIDFDAAASVYIDLKCMLVGYDDGGLTFTLPWSASSGTSSQVRWEMAIRAMVDDAEDIDSAHTYVFNGVSDTAPSVSGELSYPTITFTDGADMDSWADGQIGIVRLFRDHDHADDAMAGDAELWGVVGKET